MRTPILVLSLVMLFFQYPLSASADEAAGRVFSNLAGKTRVGRCYKGSLEITFDADLNILTVERYFEGNLRRSCILD